MEPNEEQIKRFWEHFGFYQEKVKEVYDIGYSTMWKNDKGYWHSALPPIDLNNLFKYAVQKLYWYILEDTFAEGHTAIVSLSDKKGQVTDKDPALALFWAINKIIEEDKGGK